MSKPVVIEYTKGDRSGETYVVESAALAKKYHPDATITGFEDGSEYEPPAPRKAKETEPAEAEKDA